MWTKGILVTVALVLLGLMPALVSSQTKDEKAVIQVIQQNGTAFAKNDVTTMKRIWKNTEDVVIFEGGHANYGWADYRDNHLFPEMKEIQNAKYEFTDIKTKISGNLAYATMKYSISGDLNKRHFESAGVATAVLEKVRGQWKLVHFHSSAPRKNQ